MSRKAKPLLLNTPAPRAGAGNLTAPKPKMVLELAEPFDREGFWIAKDDIELTRYRIPFFVPKGRVIEVVEDRGDRVMAHIDERTSIYIDSDIFDPAFERKK